MGEYLFLGSAMLSIANGTLLLWINPRRTVNQAFFLSCLCISLWCLCVAMAIREGNRSLVHLELLRFWLRASSGVGAFLCWLIWLTKAAIVERDSKFHILLIRSWPWFCVSCTISGVAFSESFIPSTATPESRERGIGYLLYAFTIMICCAWFLFDAVKRDARLHGIRKIEQRYFVVNAIIACLLVIFAHAISLYADIEWLRRSSLIFFPLLNCAAVWAICHHRVFDAKHIVFAVGQRLLLVGTLGMLSIILYECLIDFLVPRLSIFLAVITMITTAVICDRPLRRFMGLDPVQILSAPRKKIIDFARESSNEDALKLRFSEFLKSWCQTDFAIFMDANGGTLIGPQRSLSKSWDGFIYLSKHGWATPETLQRSKSETGSDIVTEFLNLNNLGALFTAPKGSNPPSLVVCLGQKESLRPYTFPDIDVLLSLVELMDNILTHSRASAHAARIEKMSSAAMISRGLAHDLNSLSTPVAAFLLHMETRVTPGSIESEVLADAKHSVTVMQDYIKESLFFARQLALNITGVDASTLLVSVAQLAQNRSRSAEASVVIHPTQGCVFEGDFALMQRALQNLVFNSIDASSPGDIIAISATTDDHQQVHLIVSDHGTGVPLEIRERIFDPYFTTRVAGNSLRGLGLGLAICKKIAELHNGSVVVLDNKPRGAIFEIILPLRQPAAKTVPIASKGGLAELAPGHLQQEAASASSTL